MSTKIEIEPRLVRTPAIYRMSRFLGESSLMSMSRLLLLAELILLNNYDGVISAYELEFTAHIMYWNEDPEILFKAMDHARFTECSKNGDRCITSLFCNYFPCVKDYSKINE